MIDFNLLISPETFLKGFLLTRFTEFNIILNFNDDFSFTYHANLNMFTKYLKGHN